MENTNINPENLSDQKRESSLPISPKIPTLAPDLSTVAKDNFLKVNQDSVPPQDNKKEDFYFGNNKVELPKEPAPSSPAKEALKKEEKAKAVITKRIANPKLKKNIIAAIAALFLLSLVGGTAYYFMFIAKNVPVTISINQEEATLVIDGQTYQNIKSPYQISLSRGEHSITAQKEGFAPLQKTVNVSPTQKNYTVSFELSAYPKIEKIHGKELFFAAYNKDLNIFSYFDKSDTGFNLKELDFGKQKETSIIENIYQINKVAWSPTFRQLTIKITNSEKLKGGQIPFLDKYGEGTKVNWVVNLDRRDLLNITIKDLHPSIKNISFSPTGDKIAYLFQNDTTKELAMANPDGSNFESLLQFKTIEFEPDVVWSPDGKRMAIFANTENAVESTAREVNVYVYNFETRSASKITSDGISSGTLFSPDGGKLLYQSGNSIWLYNLDAKEEEAALDLKLQASLSNSAWIDAQSFVALSASDNTLYQIKTSGIKENINYQKDSLPANIKSILYGNNKIFLLNNEGVYQLIMEENI